MRIALVSAGARSAPAGAILSRAAGTHGRSRLLPGGDGRDAAFHADDEKRRENCCPRRRKLLPATTARGAGHYQEATDVYKRILLEGRENLALHVYVALCYYKLDFNDVRSSMRKIVYI